MSINRVSERQDDLSPVGYSADKKVARIGKRFLNALVSALKTAQIYDFNNVAFRDRLQALDGILKEAFLMEGEAIVEVAANHVFFNGVRLPMDFASYPVYRFLMDLFKTVSVGTIRFEDGLQSDELGNFLAVFAKTTGKVAKDISTIENEFEGLGVVHIRLMEPQRRDEDFVSTTEVRKVGKQMYMKSIMILNDVIGGSQAPVKVQGRIVRRLVQNIVDSVVRDEAYMLALTNIKNHFDYTLNHSLNVCVLSTALGYRLGLEKGRLADLGIAALFHDVGKVEIPLEILAKPSRVTPEEYEVIKRHPYHGAEILTRIKGFRRHPVRAILVALEHHMGMDLSGYPDAPFRKQVNLFSKIVTIADVFDAITTKRVYQEAIRRDVALQKMMAESGRKFDPILLKAFASMLGLYPIGCLVLLSTGELAVVVETNENPSCIDAPIVKLITTPSGERIDGPMVDLCSSSSGTDGEKPTIVRSVDAVKYGIDVTDYF